jgi:L-threonylcarbamoyladenylate synthase
MSAEQVWWPNDPSWRGAVAHHAGELIRLGKLVVYPTDTVYGLGTDPLNPEAILKIYDAKQRPPEKAIVWLISSLDRADSHCEITDAASKLASRYWPGALTVVLKRRNPGPDDLPTQAIRIPNHDCALAIIAASGGVVATTSANRSGLPAARSARDAHEALGEAVDLIVDAGYSPGGVESTVLDLSSSQPKVLRKGPVTGQEIEDLLGAKLAE